MKKDYLSEREFADWIAGVGRIDDFSLARSIDIFTAELYRRQSLHRASMFLNGQAEAAAAMQASQQTLPQQGDANKVQ